MNEFLTFPLDDFDKQELCNINLMKAEDKSVHFT